MIITIHDTGVGMQINNIASKFYSSVKYIKFKYIKFKYIKFIPTINEITNSYNFYYILPISNKITTMFMNIKFLKIINVIYNNRYVYNLQYKTYNKTLNNYVRYKLFYCSLIHEFINTQLDAITLS